MTESQEQLINELLEWADYKGNWIFRRDLGLYVELFKKWEAEYEGIDAGLRKYMEKV